MLAELVKPGGRVVGVEHIQPLVDLGTANTGKSAEGRELMESVGIKYVKADGRLGYEAGGPYDAIHVGAAAVEVHMKLVEQLKAPGRYVNITIARGSPPGRSFARARSLLKCADDHSLTHNSQTVHPCRGVSRTTHLRD